MSRAKKPPIRQRKAAAPKSRAAGAAKAAAAKTSRKKPASRRPVETNAGGAFLRLSSWLGAVATGFSSRPRWLRHTSIGLGLAGVFGLAVLVGCETTGTAPSQLPPPGNLVLEPASFDVIPGWGGDRLAEAWPALQKSCDAIGKQPADQPLGPAGLAGTPADWQPACREVTQVAAFGEPVLRQVLETSFRPYLAHDSNGRPGLFTAYYEPELDGSLTPSARYHVPLYRQPAQPVSFSRQEIDNGALKDQNLELIWVTDPVDAFMLQIQGSGRIRLPDGRIQRVGYAGNNGQPFGGIGKMMIDAGLIDREHASMQSIRAWLKSHPDEAPGWMQKNARYIFFRMIAGDGPIGAESLPLTPGRSLAVDTGFLALGLPLWLDTTWPVDLGTARKGDPLRRLMVAQDVGSAIKGPVRGDIFWGSGEPALTFAGSMKNSGSYYVFLPVSVAARREIAISDVTTP